MFTGSSPDSNTIHSNNKKAIICIFFRRKNCFIQKKSVSLSITAKGMAANKPDL